MTIRRQIVRAAVKKIFCDRCNVASVLIVDDDTDGAELLARLFRRAGHEGVIARSGREALAMFADVAPDVIVLDVLMPEMDGLAFLKVLRGYYRGFSIPVIVLTAAWGTDTLDRVVALGVKRVFRKGDYHLAEILDCIQTLVPQPSTPITPPGAAPPVQWKPAGSGDGLRPVAG